MSTTVTINSAAENLTWPKRCVCCGGLDETDIEVIVQDTVDPHRAIEEVITAEVPHCLECRDHSSMGFGAKQIIALVLVICLADGFLWTLEQNHAYLIAAIGFGAILAIIGLDQARTRVRMKKSCTAARRAYKFAHPSGQEITTVILRNESFAREFKALNGQGTYEP